MTVGLVHYLRVNRKATRLTELSFRNGEMTSTEFMFGNGRRQSQAEFDCQESCLFYIPHGKHLTKLKLSFILRQTVILDATRKEKNCYL